MALVSVKTQFIYTGMLGKENLNSSFMLINSAFS